MKANKLNLALIPPLEEKFAAICFVRLPGSMLFRVRTIPQDAGFDIEQVTDMLTRLCTRLHNGVWYFVLKSNEEMDVVGENINGPVMFFEPDLGDLIIKHNQLN